MRREVREGSDATDGDMVAAPRARSAIGVENPSRMPDIGAAVLHPSLATPFVPTASTRTKKDAGGSMKKEREGRGEEREGRIWRGGRGREEMESKGICVIRQCLLGWLLALLVVGFCGDLWNLVRPLGNCGAL